MMRKVEFFLTATAALLLYAVSPIDYAESSRSIITASSSIGCQDTNEPMSARQATGQHEIVVDFRQMMEGLRESIDATIARFGPRRVGEIKIVGNAKVPDRVIREAIGLYPGQQIDAALIRSAEDSLAMTGLFVVDRKNGIWPIVTVVETREGRYRDVLVAVQEPNE
jgi:Surface antigen variable number repeat